MVVALLLAATPALASAQQSTEPESAADTPVEKAEPTTPEEEESPTSSGTARPILQEPMQESTGPGQVWGSVRSEGQIAIGIRAVSQDGSESRYDKDIDLDSGVRILDTHWVLSPANRSVDTWYDRIVVDVNGAYGDPYENYAAQVYKAGRYRFDARTRKADYKYAVTGSHNVWDTTRWFTDVSASLNATTALELYAGFNHVSQNGDTGRTLDISRNEFEVDVPLDSRSQTWLVGGRYHRGGTSFYLQQEQYSFKNNVPRSTESNTGLNPDEAEVDFFSEQEVQAIDAPATKGGFSANLLDNRVQVDGDLMYSKQRLATSFDSYWEGLNFQRALVNTLDGAAGSGDREVLHGNIFAGFSINRAASFTARYRHRSWDQNAFTQVTGAQRFVDSGDSTLSQERYFTDYSITDNQFLVGAKGNFVIGSAYGEVGFSNREQIFDNDVFADDADTQTVAFRFGGTLRPNRMLDLKASYDYGDIDDPFTSISPTRVDRFRLRINSRPVMGLIVGGHYTYRKVENTVSEFDFKQQGFGLNASYVMDTSSFFTVSYTRQSLDRSIPTSFWVGFAAPTLSTVLQDLANNVFSVAADVTLSDTVPFAIYGSASVVSSDSDELGFIDATTPGAVVALNFYDVIAGVRYTFARGLFFDAQGRFIDYADDNVFVNGLDDYDAAIFTLALGFRFD
jgi:hypothetical protein